MGTPGGHVPEHMPAQAHSGTGFRTSDEYLPRGVEPERTEMRMSGESVRSYLVWGRNTSFTVIYRWSQTPAAVDQQMTDHKHYVYHL